MESAHGGRRPSCDQSLRPSRVLKYLCSWLTRDGPKRSKLTPDTCKQTQTMRGADTFTESLFTMRKLEDFVPADQPLRPIRAMVNEALIKMDDLFAGMYEADIKGGRPSIAPEKLLRAMLLQVFFSVRSDRQLMEQTQYNLLYRWFIGLAMDDAVWVPSVFTKNRKRLIAHDAIIELFNPIVETIGRKGWLSGQHFSVDGTLIQAWASHRSFVRKNSGDDDADDNNTDSTSFKGQTRSNDTHASRIAHR